MAITNFQDYIKGLYDPQRTAAQAAYDATAADLNAKISGADQVYQPYSNQAYTTQQMTQRANNENLANMGYSAGGQTSQSLQQRGNNALLNTLGSINTSKQDYINSLGSELRNANTTLQSNLAQIGMNEGTQQINAYSAEQSRADQLYSAGIISAAQYQQMTGIAPNVKKSSGGSGYITVNGQRMSQSQYANYLSALANSPVIASKKEKSGMSAYL